MNTLQNAKVNSSRVISSIRSEQRSELYTIGRINSVDVPQATCEALQNPQDFPPLESAIVAGDRVALAVDPNLPSVGQVVLGAVKAISLTAAEAIDIVIGDEAKPETVDAIGQLVGTEANVVVHHPSERDSLRYLGADQAADPIYLNRYLVDADVVLPLVVARPLDTEFRHDLTGIYPSFADSATRYRFQNCKSGAEEFETEISQLAWLLGVQMIVSLWPSGDGGVYDLIAGTPVAIRTRWERIAQWSATFPSPPALVVVSLDGDAQQQTWTNAARAVVTAARVVEPGGTIVLLSQIDSPPTGKLLKLSDQDDRSDRPPRSDGGFPVWDDSIIAAEKIGRVAAEHRLVIQSRVDRETIEALGLGVVDGVDDLARLSESFRTCAVIRAAQFLAP